MKSLRIDEKTGNKMFSENNTNNNKRERTNAYEEMQFLCAFIEDICLYTYTILNGSLNHRRLDVSSERARALTFSFFLFSSASILLVQNSSHCCHCGRRRLRYRKLWKSDARFALIFYSLLFCLELFLCIYLFFFVAVAVNYRFRLARISLTLNSNKYTRKNHWLKSHFGK